MNSALSEKKSEPKPINISLVLTAILLPLVLALETTPMLSEAAHIGIIFCKYRKRSSTVGKKKRKRKRKDAKAASIYLPCLSICVSLAPKNKFTIEAPSSPSPSSPLSPPPPLPPLSPHTIRTHPNSYLSSYLSPPFPLVDGWDGGR